MAIGISIRYYLSQKARKADILSGGDGKTCRYAVIWEGEPVFDEAFRLAWIDSDDGHFKISLEFGSDTFDRVMTGAELVMLKKKQIEKDNFSFVDVFKISLPSWLTVAGWIDGLENSSKL